MAETAIAAKREVLIAARLRFSPEAQSVRKAAIDGLVKQSLALVESFTLTLPQLEQEVEKDVGSGAVGRADLAASLKRLSSLGEVDPFGHGLDNRKYRLSPSARAQLENASRESASRLDRVTSRLYKNAPGGSGQYKRPFVDCLAIIFARVADIYIRLLRAEVERHEFATGTAVKEALDRIAVIHSGLDGRTFARGIYAFLTELDPEFDEIKFNMTQNYYISRMLGLDEAGRLLSREMFGEAILYLDTNVFHDALEPQARLYHQFQTLSAACDKLGIQLRVCQISLDEHRALISYHRELVDKVEDQIPPKTATKVGSLFYQAYVDAKRKDPKVTTEEVFERFAATRERLSKQHGVELVDDAWFDKNKETAATMKLAEHIQKQVTELTGRTKRDRAACHDALLLEWVEKERSTEVTPVWLITLDSSLCTFFPEKERGDPRPLAITLDALLQWISPIAAAEGLEGSMREIFAEALKYQLLPQDRFLDLDDFLLFAELEWSCKDLPADDVEECVHYLRHEAAGLDMTKAEDRERVARQLAKFFLDPARKYQEYLQQLERALKEKDAKLAEVQRQADARYEELEGQHAKRLKASEEAANRNIESLRVQTAKELAERDARIADLASRADQEQEQRRRDEVRKSAYRRLALTVVSLLLLQALAIWLTIRFDFLPREIILVAPFPIAVFLGWQIIGHERFRTLSWSVQKVFRAEDSSE